MLLYDLVQISEYKDEFLMLIMASAVAFLFKSYNTKNETINKNSKEYMGRMEVASDKFIALNEKQLEYQSRATEADIRLAEATTKQAEATKALGEIVKEGFNDLGKKLEDTKNQIVAHIDIKNKQ